MKVLVVAATAFEIAPFTDWLPRAQADADVLITGIGLMNTSWHLCRQLALKEYQLVVQAGIGGSFDKRIPLGAVVKVKKDRIADLGVWEQKAFNNVYDMKLVKPNQFPYRNGWLVNTTSGLDRADGIPFVAAVSVNRITTGTALIRQWEEKYNPSVESMEGAAFHYACLMAGIPFLQLRSISNYVGERDKSKWKLKASIASLNETLVKIISPV